MSVSLCCLQSRVEGGLLLDPSADETHREDGGLLLALMPTCNEVRRRGPVPRRVCGQLLAARVWQRAC